MIDSWQARVAGVVTMVIDGIVPFIIISVLNSLIIRAIQQRHRELDTFNMESDTSDAPRNISPGTHIDTLLKPCVPTFCTYDTYINAYITDLYTHIQICAMC